MLRPVVSILANMGFGGKRIKLYVFAAVLDQISAPPLGARFQQSDLSWRRSGQHFDDQEAPFIADVLPLKCVVVSER